MCMCFATVVGVVARSTTCEPWDSLFIHPKFEDLYDRCARSAHMDALALGGRHGGRTAVDIVRRSRRPQRPALYSARSMAQRTRFHVHRSTALLLVGSETLLVRHDPTACANRPLVPSSCECSLGRHRADASTSKGVLKPANASILVFCRTAVSNIYLAFSICNHGSNNQGAKRRHVVCHTNLGCLVLLS